MIITSTRQYLIVQVKVGKKPGNDKEKKTQRAQIRQTTKALLIDRRQYKQIRYLLGARVALDRRHTTQRQR